MHLFACLQTAGTMLLLLLPVLLSRWQTKNNNKLKSSKVKNYVENIPIRKVDEVQVVLSYL